MSSDTIAIRVSHPGCGYSSGGPHEQYLTPFDAIPNSIKTPFICREKTWRAIRGGFLLRNDIDV